MGEEIGFGEFSRKSTIPQTDLVEELQSQLEFSDVELIDWARGEGIVVLMRGHTHDLRGMGYTEVSELIELLMTLREEKGPR